LTIIKKELPLKVIFKESYFYMLLYVLFRYDIVESKKKKKNLKNINLMYTLAKTPTLIYTHQEKSIWNSLVDTALERL
jgi:hypothetical protein